MSVRSKIFTVLSLALTSASLLPGAALAQDEPSLTLPDCGRAMPINRALLTQVEYFTGTATGRGSAVLIGTLRAPEYGTVAFVRTKGIWRAYAIEANARPQGVFASSNGKVFAWSMVSTEGPGNSYQGMSIAATGARFCTRVKFPADLNNPTWANEFLDLQRFNIDGAGKGALIGVLETDTNGGTRTINYRYTTRDHGRRWSAPRPTTARGPIPGLYRPLPESKSADTVSPEVRRLIASLKRR